MGRRIIALWGTAESDPYSHMQDFDFQNRNIVKYLRKGAKIIDIFCNRAYNYF